MTIKPQHTGTKPRKSIHKKRENGHWATQTSKNWNIIMNKYPPRISMVGSIQGRLFSSIAKACNKRVPKRSFAFLMTLQIHVFHFFSVPEKVLTTHSKVYRQVQTNLNILILNQRQARVILQQPSVIIQRQEWNGNSPYILISTRHLAAVRAEKHCFRLFWTAFCIPVISPYWDIKPIRL